MPPIEGELTAPDDSIRESIVAAMDGDDASPDVSQSAGEPSDQSNTTDGVVQSDNKTNAEQAPSEDGRQRGPDGKFIAKDQAAPVAAQVSPSTDAAKASTEAAQTVASAPPAGWTAAEKAEWQKLPPAVQAAVSRREAEIANGGQQWSEQKRRYEAVLAPVAEAARRNGLNTEAGLKALLDAQSFLERDPTAAIKWLAQSHGVNLATLAGHQPDEGSSAQTPDIQAMVRQIVQQTVAPVVAPIQQRWQQEEQRQNDMTMQAIHSFASAHEHYPAVEATIALILPQVIEENPTWTNEQKLQEAYDRALYATPATRQQVLAARESTEAEKRRQEAATRATKARSAAVSVTGAPQGSAATEAAGSLREEIVRAMTG